MTYSEYTTHLKVCEYLGKEPTGQYKKIHDHLTNIFDGLECEVDYRYNRIIFQKQQKWFFYQNNKSGYLRCNYDRVWSFFRNDMGMESADTKDFIKSMVEEHLKCKVGTPALLEQQKAVSVEEHLKCKVGTPSAWQPCGGITVEEHLKCKVGTP